MHRTTIALIGAILISAAYVSAKPAAPAGNDNTYRGCLIPGSSETSFMLTNAVQKGDKSKTKVSLKVVPENPKVNVAAQVTKEVEVTGSVEPNAQPGQPGTLKATKISWKADYCG